VDGALSSLNIDLFGSLVVRIDDRKIDGLPRKAGALLAYLAMHQGDVLLREQLGDLFWPDRVTRLSLQGVRNSLAAIGQKLGQSNDLLRVTARTVELRVAEVDLVRFADLAQSHRVSDLEAASMLYRGEVGLDLSSVDSEPFQDWLREERERAAQYATEALRRLIGVYQEANNHSAAIKTAQRLVAVDPLSETSHRSLMWAYARGGCRGDALRHYQRLVQSLRAELNVAPDPETAEAAAAIGQLDTAFVTLSIGHLENPPAASSSSLVKALPRWPLLRPSLSVGFVPLQSYNGSRVEGRKVAALNDDLITDLVRHGHGLSFERVDPIIHAINQVSRSIVDCDYVLTSALHASGARRHLNVQLLDGRLGRFCWTQRYALSTDVDITETIARDVHFALIRESSRHTAYADQNAMSIPDSLANAAGAFGERATLDGTREAHRLLLQVLVEQPDHGDALTGLARACQHIVSQPGWADAATTAAAIAVGTKATEAALSTNPTDPSAHLFLGMLLSASGKLSAASREFDCAISLNPQFAAVHAFAGYNDAFLGLIEHTLPAIERAQALGWNHRRPAVPWFFAGFAHLLLGQSKTAIELLGKSLDANPDFGSAHLFLAAALWLEGRVTDAKTGYEKFRDRFEHYQLSQFDAQWVSRSNAPTYQRQITPIVGAIKAMEA